MKHYGAVDDPKDITSNPFQITFDDLEGLTVSSGIWNTGQRRLEC